MLGWRTGVLYTCWKYAVTVVLFPSLSNLSELAPACVNLFIARGRPLLAPARVVILKLAIKRWRRSLSRSGNPPLGERAFGLFLFKKRRHRSIKGPLLYITPEDMSRFTTILPMAGRIDWKYPRHISRPPPMYIFSRFVKNDRTLNGYRMFGSIRMTILSA